MAIVHTRGKKKPQYSHFLTSAKETMHPSSYFSTIDLVISLNSNMHSILSHYNSFPSTKVENSRIFTKYGLNDASY